MKAGQEVYTVNNKTNEIDKWICSEIISTSKATLVHLKNKGKECFLPLNCVFESLDDASKIAMSQKIFFN